MGRILLLLLFGIGLMQLIDLYLPSEKNKDARTGSKLEFLPQADSLDLHLSVIRISASVLDPSYEKHQDCKEEEHVLQKTFFW